MAVSSNAFRDAALAGFAAPGGAVEQTAPSACDSSSLWGNWARLGLRLRLGMAEIDPD